MTFHFQLTGQGEVKATESGVRRSLDIERGAALVVHHSPADGVIQVFLQPPYVSDKEPKRDALLIEHTFNTDDVTPCWVEKQIARLLVFNRAESVLQRARPWDRFKVRLWRFLDVRNRRGYLGAFQHLLTPWELVVLAVLVFAIGPWLSA